MNYPKDRWDVYGYSKWRREVICYCIFLFVITWNAAFLARQRTLSGPNHIGFQDYLSAVLNIIEIMFVGYFLKIELNEIRI